jgi:16S rRNA (guanine527-N7)-methyltransferase
MALSAALHEVLAEAQTRGTIGPGPLDTHIAHALDFFVEGCTARRCVDLGSGGGLPGLPLALAHPATEWVLLESRGGRVRGLEEAVERLALGARVTVSHQRAEDAGRGALRGWADLVTARSFGPPSTTAECAAPLLRPDGVVVVSEPEGVDRWPADAIAVLGLRSEAAWTTERGAFRAFRLTQPCPDRFPRQPAAIARRPLF